MRLRRLLGPAVLTILLLGVGGADALPIAPARAAEQGLVRMAQYRPGYHQRHQYRRALRHYRGNPGARFELRQNRRIYCRNTPERC